MRYSRAAQGYVATAAYLIGDYAGAVAAAEVAGDAIINLPAWQAASLVRLGDRAAAGRAMRRFLDLALPAWTGGPQPDRDRDASTGSWAASRSATTRSAPTLASATCWRRSTKKGGWLGQPPSWSGRKQPDATVAAEPRRYLHWAMV